MTTLSTSCSENIKKCLEYLNYYLWHSKYDYIRYLEGQELTGPIFIGEKELLYNYSFSELDRLCVNDDFSIVQGRSYLQLQIFSYLQYSILQYNIWWNSMVCYDIWWHSTLHNDIWHYIMTQEYTMALVVSLCPFTTFLD